jgi:hypothetical protein
MTTEIHDTNSPMPADQPLSLKSNEGLGVTRADWECEWTPTEKDGKLYELAKRYHDETEAYDRTVCSGPVVHGSIQPIGPWELGAINRNARQVFDRIAQEAARHEISRAELWHAVGRHA